MFGAHLFSQLSECAISDILSFPKIIFPPKNASRLLNCLRCPGVFKDRQYRLGGIMDTSENPEIAKKRLKSFPMMKSKSY